MFIAYSRRNGAEYATATESVRVGGKIIKSGSIYLGRVIDKENGIYSSRERGTFVFDPDTGGFGKADLSRVPKAVPKGREKLTVDFGDSYFIDAYMRNRGFLGCMERCGCGNTDTFSALVQLMILTDTAFANADIWYSGNYARLLYPKADMDGRRISDFLESIGDDRVQRAFFREYVPMITSGTKDVNVAIDSTGLPNSVHFPLTAVSNHNGDISQEVRLILVVQLGSRLPIFYRAVPGNIIDASTLIRTLEELKLMNIDVGSVIIDAGYCDLKNIAELYESKVSFVTRLKPNLLMYKDAVSEHLDELDSVDNLVTYGGRAAYVVRSRCEPLDGHGGYAYLIRDLERKRMDDAKTTEKLGNGEIPPSKAHGQFRRNGIFVLLSSEFMPIEDILPTYYARQGVEQFIDVGKNYANMVPVRVHSTETFNGLMLATFIASAVVQSMMNDLKDTDMSPKAMFMSLRNQKCKVYDDVVLRDESTAGVSKVYRHFGLDPAFVIPLQNSDR